MRKLTDPPLWTSAVAHYPYSSGLEASLKFTSRFGEDVALGVRQGNRLLVPRNLAPSLGKDLRVTNNIGPIACKKPPRSEEQLACIRQSVSLLKRDSSHVLEAPTGFGKCLLAGERVLMFDGTLKKVEDVRVGDVLMGPDSRPRRVFSLGEGVTPAYKLRTSKGDVLRCNDEHILSLRCVRSNTHAKRGSLVNVSVREFLTWPRGVRRHFKLWRPERVDFPQVQTLSVPPYDFGFVLGYEGVGSTQNFLAGPHPGCSDAASPLEFAEAKLVPIEYKVASYAARLQLIAGVLDAGGYVTQEGFGYVTRHRQMAEDLCYLARSVGLCAVWRAERKKCSTQDAGTVYRVVLSGSTGEIPVRLKVNKEVRRETARSSTCYRFQIFDIGVQKYFGFTLDDDHLYLTEAFLATHNTYIGSAIAASLGETTLILMTKQDLMKSWQDTLVNLVGVSPNDIGAAQADKLVYKGKRFVLGMVQSVIRPDKYDSDFFDYFGFIIFDETHRLAAESFSQACTLFPAKYRLGLSATPERSDGKTPVIAAHIGPVLVRGRSVPMRPKILVENTGWSLPPQYANVNPGKMMAVYKTMGESKPRNSLLCKFIVSAYSKNRNVLVMADTIDHLNTLFMLCGELGVPGEDMGFYTGKTKRELLQLNAMRKVVFATYGMTSEGTDFPHWDTLVLATPRVNVKQAVGRVLRQKAGKPQPIVFDPVDAGSIFKSFYYRRMKQYYEIGATLVNV